MAAKSTNVLARVEPEIKKEAESIMSKLGIPASVVINMLYKQIIMTKSIPFPLSLPKEPISLDSITTEEFNTIMETGLSQAKADRSRPYSDVFAGLRQEITNGWIYCKNHIPSRKSYPRNHSLYNKWNKSSWSCSSFIDSLENSFTSLRNFPQCVSLTDIEPCRTNGIHCLSVKNFLVYFWINEETKTVQITAVIYTKRDQIRQSSQMDME